jgi:hypothetical protein
MTGVYDFDGHLAMQEHLLREIDVAVTPLRDGLIDAIAFGEHTARADVATRAGRVRYRWV